MSRYTKTTPINLHEWSIYTSWWIFREVWEIWSNEFIPIPPIFKYDGVSSPRIMQWYIPRIEVSTIVPGCSHDWGYKIKWRVKDYCLANMDILTPVLQAEWIDIDLFIKNLKNYTRQEIDLMFYDQLIAFNNPHIKSAIMCDGVYLFGYRYWNQPITEEGKKYLKI